jgi:hypothetical protein
MWLDILTTFCVLIFMYEFILAVLLSMKAFWAAIVNLEAKLPNLSCRFFANDYSVYVMTITSTWLICRHLLKLF